MRFWMETNLVSILSIIFISLKFGANITKLLHLLNLDDEFLLRYSFCHSDVSSPSSLSWRKTQGQSVQIEVWDTFLSGPENTGREIGTTQSGKEVWIYIMEDFNQCKEFVIYSLGTKNEHSGYELY